MLWGTLIDGAITYFSKRSERKDRIKEAKVKAEEERILKGMDNSGWKDEWLVLLLSFPYIMAFIPNETAQKTVKEGFITLQSFPEWWQFTFVGIVGAVFGLRKLIDYKGGMK